MYSVDCTQLMIFLPVYTVLLLLQAAASNHFDEFFGQNLLGKKLGLLRLLFEGGFYLRAASNTDNTVNLNPGNMLQCLQW